MAYRDFRYSEILIAALRETKIYIHSDAAGDEDGGGGTGTYADPYLVRHTGDLSLLFLNVLSGITNLGIFFYDDDVIPGEPANTDQTITIDWASVSIGRTGDGTRRPEITGFIPLVENPVMPASASSHFGGATDIGGGVYEIAPDTPGLIFYWVRGRLASSTDPDDVDLQPYSIALDEADCAATPYSFFSDGTNNFINPGDHDITRCEVTTNTGAGFVFKNVADCACDDTILGGFGMNALFTAGGGQALRTEVLGTNTFVARRNKILWGHYHTSGHFVTAGVGTGGISTWHYCEFGYHLWDGPHVTTHKGGGGGDGNVCYNGNGGHEYGRYNCIQRRGGLDMTDGYFAAWEAAFLLAYAFHSTLYGNINTVLNKHGLSAGTPYGHASGGTFASYFFEIDCTWAAESGQMIVNDHMCGSVPAVADKDLQTSYIGGSINRTVTAMAAAPDGLWGVHESFRLTFKVAWPDSSPFAYLFSSGALKGIFTNFEITIESVGAWASKSVRIFNSGTHDFRWIHPRLRIIGTDCRNVATFWAAGLATCTIYNGVASVEATGLIASEFDLTGSGNHFTEASVSTGGIIGLGTWTIAAAQVNGLTGVVSLAAAATWTTAAGVPTNCRNASQALPANIECWRDLLGRRRHYSQALRSLGPIEGNPQPLRTRRNRGAYHIRGAFEPV